MKELQTKIPVMCGEANISIYFYQTNGMPALLLEDDNGESIDDLTVNHQMYFDQAVSLRSDEKEKIDKLIDAGWIGKEPFTSQPSGFIYILYYKLTDEAYERVKESAQEQKANYPKENNTCRIVEL